MTKPIPVPDKLSKPFWDACNERRLVLQNCTSCNKLQYPPQETCGTCHSAEHLEWREVSGRGHILEFFIERDARIRRLQVNQPFIIALITLDEDPGINFLSNLPGILVDEVPVGAAVEVFFEELVLPEGMPKEEAPVQLIHEWRVVKSQSTGR